jgi:hypothetical protein
MAVERENDRACHIEKSCEVMCHLLCAYVSRLLVALPKIFNYSAFNEVNFFFFRPDSSGMRVSLLGDLGIDSRNRKSLSV